VKLKTDGKENLIRIDHLTAFFADMANKCRSLFQSQMLILHSTEKTRTIMNAEQGWATEFRKK
jgi:hypothetical protein